MSAEQRAQERMIRLKARQLRELRQVARNQPPSFNARS